VLESARFVPGGRLLIWNSPAFGLAGIGSYLATSIVGLTLLGRWLDGRFDSAPVLTLVFLVLGLLLGFYGAYRQLQQLLARTGRPGGGEGR
jgi:F0F1-type ATP synthase assembly protein I